MTSTLFIGLISGTSMDAVDCALVEIVNDKLTMLDFHEHKIPQELKQQILSLHEDGPDQVHWLGRTDVELGRLFAEATLETLRKNQLTSTDIAAIGSHGQTIRHQPPRPDPGNKDSISYTLQIADPNTICELTGITTVADFRRKDMASGGQGAPLVPAFHREVFACPDVDRIILNVGGIANITLIPGDSSVSMPAFDTGPGNVLMDTWIRQCRSLEFDEAGQWAASGTPITELLDACLNEAYFSLSAPKSTGRELFNLKWLEHKLKSVSGPFEQEDIQATLLALTILSIRDAISENLSRGELIVCGGGARNQAIMQGLAKSLPAFKVVDSGQAGIDPDGVEAAAFAWLAQKTITRTPVDFMEITGSTHPNIMGGIYYCS